MSLPWETAARWAGGAFGIMLGLAALFVLSNATEGGISCHKDSTLTVRPDTTVPVNGALSTPVYDTVHVPIAPDVEARMDSLIGELFQRDVALAEALQMASTSFTRVLPFRTDVDSSRVVIGRMIVDYYGLNGQLVGQVAVDSLIVPLSVLRIRETVVVATGIEWWYLPLVAVIAFVFGWAV